MSGYGPGMSVVFTCDAISMVDDIRRSLQRVLLRYPTVR
jgi:hypothetical protein